MNKDRKSFFVSGTGTDVGKTIFCTILAQKLGVSYWKPIQCGKNADGKTDSEIVDHLTAKNIKIQKNTYYFKHPLSPNIAAKKNKSEINVKKILNLKKEYTKKEGVIVEGAGGLMVPINNSFLMVDLIKVMRMPLILIASTKLGTINHTLLSINLIKQMKLNFHGIVFMGKKNYDTEETIITEVTKNFFKELNIIARVPKFTTVNKKSICNALKYIPTK